VAVFFQTQEILKVAEFNRWCGHADYQRLSMDSFWELKVKTE
jgi:hypothetical protein